VLLDPPQNQLRIGIGARKLKEKPRANAKRRRANAGRRMSARRGRVCCRKTWNSMKGMQNPGLTEVPRWWGGKL
jgi:hypothetical protein